MEEYIKLEGWVDTDGNQLYMGYDGSLWFILRGYLVAWEA